MDGQYFNSTTNKDGIHYRGTNNRHVTLVQTVSENEVGYSKIQIKNEKLSRELYYKVGHPSKKDFKNWINYNLISNRPVTLEDANQAEKYTDPIFMHSKAIPPGER